jgi:hypothetical protein
MTNPWVSLRHDQLIPVNKAVNEQVQLEKGLEEEEKKTSPLRANFTPRGNSCCYTKSGLSGRSD